MIRFSVVGFTLAFLLLLSGCIQGPLPAPPDLRAADQKAIAAVEAAWVAAWKSKDVEKILSHYADDAIYMEPGRPEMNGKEAIRAGIKAFMADGNFQLSFAPTHVEASKGGDLAYSYGTYTATLTDAKTGKPANESGRYVCLYRKQADGSWKAILDIDNPEAAAK